MKRFRGKVYRRLESRDLGFRDLGLQRSRV